MRQFQVELSIAKLAGSLCAEVEITAFAVGGNEDAVVHIGVDCLRESGFNLNGGKTVHQLAGAEVFQPVFG